MQNLNGTNSSDTLYGSSNDDLIKPKNGTDVVYGGEGNDQINAFVNSSGERRFYTTSGILQAYGGSGDDLIGGKTGNDYLEGGDGNDYLWGKEGEDVLKGDNGDDTLKGGDGNDELDGGDGDDKLYGGAGNNNLLGGLGNDILNVYLESGDNILSGGGGDDTLWGGEGNDTLNGGSGYDVLWGSNGDDKYVISSRDFDLYDSDGNDSAIIKTDFVKVPSTIENVTYDVGVKALPYWIDALIADSGASYLSLLGDQKQFSYGYPQLIPDYIESDSEEINGWMAFNSAQRLLSDSALSYIDSLLDVSFNETDDYAQPNVITFANNWQEGSGAYAFHPSSSFSGSDFYYNRKYIDEKFTEGEWAATTFLHEIGHALGLKHPFSGSSTSVGPYLSELEDNTKWTEMSYTDHSTEDYLLQFSPFDIAVLQYLYGPDKNSRAGNDTYYFKPYQSNFIWDGAGVDLIDASTSNEGVSIYLTPGDWSFKGTRNSELISSAGQLTINFGTEIENLLGSAFNDKLFGNELANELKGGSGNDYLYGYSGNDLISGGVGKDILSGGNGVDTFLFHGESELGDIITDFTVGMGGDEVNVNSLLASLGYSGSNPFSAGWLEVEQSGTDLTINLDRNGGGDSFSQSVVTLNNISTPNLVGEMLTSGSLRLVPKQENTAPTDIILSNNSLAENSASAIVGTLSVTDPDKNDSHSLTLSGLDSSQFEIVNNQLKLKSGFSADYETKSTYSVGVTAKDLGGLSRSETFIINVTDDVSEAFIIDDVVNLQQGLYAAQKGNDVYVLSPLLVKPNAEITIIDIQDTNKLQLIGGLTIESALLASKTLQLTLSNKAVVTVLDAERFIYETGGDPVVTGTAGVSYSTFNDFTSSVFGKSVPGDDKTIVQAGGAVIQADGRVTDVALVGIPSLGADEMLGLQYDLGLG